jgi:CheY-like chemotaxis protein
MSAIPRQLPGREQQPAAATRELRSMAPASLFLPCSILNIAAIRCMGYSLQFKKLNGLEREMQNAKAKLLIVDDESSILESLSRVLVGIGYQVRTAEDGISALIALSQETPEVLISDLNMPGMPGTELLAVVRRWYPNLKTIAMSGAFSGDEMPSGVAADAFYQKGSSVVSMLKIIENLPWHERMPLDRAMPLQQALRGLAGDGQAEEALTMVFCPVCLRPFSQAVNEAVLQRGEAFCVACGGLIQGAVKRSIDEESLRRIQQIQAC